MPQSVKSKTTARSRNLGKETLTKTFNAILDELQDLHDRKQKDYGTGEDPLFNMRSSANAGIPPWIGGLIRAGDKLHRLQKFARTGKLANESVIDSFNDLAVYAIICRQLFEQEITGK